MENNKYKELSIPELEKKRASLKKAASFLAGILICLFGVTVWSTIRNGEFDWLMLVAISLSIIVFTNFREAKKISREIESRG